MKLAHCRCLFIACILCGPAGAGAAPVYAGGGDPVENILVNQTITVAGQAFHAAFAALWADLPALPGVGLAIRERPSARRGTAVEVEHANRIIFSAILPPARANIRPLAEQAVQVVHEHAVAQQVRRLLRDDDLAPDEL